ncbi:NAD(P)-dependent alcohol dehydrogenase [Planotetraspora kaengkrachanensis]|uniref:Alcohol dehydrogenase n=1 Tax=Planotetraspora kaengkrachanensis TaxID=575193 RepID=A0A8J3M5R6_9ACTN|nr:NAD(P)-dependent alcohol dehydrogenase [Planotetraspora kaengkrachanensis]GIG77655.1 alcohol dehydrogenase [Planotetraspora kaengkrachanensis]
MRVRAAVAQERSRPFVFEELELDEPQGDEVLVAVTATGVCQTDAHVRSGHIPVPLPIVLGHEGAGVVERVGPDVMGLKPGDHVVLSFLACGHCAQCLSGRPAYCDDAVAANFSGARLDGTRGLRRTGAGNGDVHGHFFGQSSFATHALATERNTVKVPGDAPLELLGPLGCGLQTGAGAVLNSLDVPAGAAVAVLGVGAVGFGALMAARLSGAGTIVAVDVNPRRLALAEELGATHALDARHVDVAKEIRRITGRGAAFVLDTTGRADMLDHAIDSLAPTGQVGLVAGGPGTVPASKLGLGMAVRGIVQGDAVPRLFIPKLVQMYQSGRFPIDRLVQFYEFGDIDAAFADAARGDVVKPVLRIADSGGSEKE